MQVVLWVSELVISPATAEKIGSKHGISTDDVRACVIGRRSPARSHEDERGLRWYVDTVVEGRRCVVVLYPDPLDEGRFAVASVYPI